jgi:hypothetical protein
VDEAHAVEHEASPQLGCLARLASTEPSPDTHPRPVLASIGEHRAHGLGTYQATA